MYEKKKYSSLFDIFKNLLEKNETIEIVNIDASIIALQKQECLKEAYKVKEFILNCSVASNSAIKAVNFEKFEDLISKTWLEKDLAAEYSYFKKVHKWNFRIIFSSLKEQITIYYKLRAGFSLR